MPSKVALDFCPSSTWQSYSRRLEVLLYRRESVYPVYQHTCNNSLGRWMTQTNGYTRPFGHVIPLLCNMARSSSAEDMQLHSDPGSADCSHRRTHGHCMCPRALQNNLSTSLFTLMLEFHRPICPAPACSTLSAAHTLVAQTTPGMQMWILGLSPRAYAVCN